MNEDDFLEAQYEDRYVEQRDLQDEPYDEDDLDLSDEDDDGCEGHEATTCGRYNGPIGETIYCDGSCRV